MRSPVALVPWAPNPLRPPSKIYAAPRRVLTRLMTKTAKATTSSMWIMLPPKLKPNPRSHKIRNKATIVHSIISSCSLAEHSLSLNSNGMGIDHGMGECVPVSRITSRPKKPAWRYPRQREYPHPPPPYKQHEKNNQDRRQHLSSLLHDVQCRLGTKAGTQNKPASQCQNRRPPRSWASSL